MTIGSQITGSVSFTKSGAGLVILTNPNNGNTGAGGYTGSTYINQGVLSVDFRQLRGERDSGFQRRHASIHRGAPSYLPPSLSR